MDVKKLREIIEPSVDSKVSRAFDLMMQALIMVSIVCISIETLPDLSNSTLSGLLWIEVVIVTIFTIEYVLRIIAAERKPAFIFSCFGIIDLLAILPFYVGLGVDLRILRMLRWFRLFRIFKLFRYNRALKHFADAMEEIKDQFMLYVMATGLLMFLSSAGIYYFEHEAQPEQFKSILHSLWWSVETLTSVGYGDIYPVTLGGRIFTGFLLPIGLGVLTVPSGLIAYGLTTVRRPK